MSAQPCIACGQMTVPGERHECPGPERWLPVVGWEGLYEVSDHGRVRSLDREFINARGQLRTHKGRVLTAKVAPSTGYRVCTLVDATQRRKLYALIHRLVLEAFVGPCPAGLECCHNDGDRGNATLRNLRWDTRAANTLDAVRQRTNLNARKTTCPEGHPYDAVTYHKAPGRNPSRYCKRCKAAKDKARRHAAAGSAGNARGWRAARSAQ